MNDTTKSWVNMDICQPGKNVIVIDRKTGLKTGYQDHILNSECADRLAELIGSWLVEIVQRKDQS